MRIFLLTVGVMIGTLSSSVTMAAEPAKKTMFDLFYDQMQQSVSDAKPTDRIAQFIIKEFESWNGRGIQITADDIDRAIAGTIFTGENDGLCQDKKDMAGKPYEFIQGAATVPGSCLALRSGIVSLLNAEKDIENFGADLMTLASSSELAVADEPHRPLDMALYSLLLRRVWSGTGASVIPWDGTADAQLTGLDTNLTSLSPEDLEKAVLRFHHGYFRDQREKDPRFSGIVDSVGYDLKNIADTLKITPGNPEAIGIFLTPKLSVHNVALWARKDDIGLMWIYPTGAFRLTLNPADQYPEFKKNGENLAYPFAYGGGIPPSGAGIKSPLCSRMIGREGYLCRPQPPTAENCDNTGDGSSIMLVQCPEDPDAVTETTSGPSICPGFKNLFTDNGTPLEDPENRGQVNPALTAADVSEICSPEKKVIYPDDITSNACYISLCLKQSMNGHTLIPNRNPVVLNEATSPYLACIRPDPQLGLYTEIAEDSPYPLPEYLGQFLVRDFERQYCSKNGDAPQPLLGLCAYNDNENAALPIQSQHTNAQTTVNIQKFLLKRGDDFTSIAASIGQRVALDQSIELERKMFAKLAFFVQHIADTFLELKRAPLTQSACPWTGMFRSSLPALSHTECINNMCEIVPGPGTSQCTNSPCTPVSPAP